MLVVYMYFDALRGINIPNLRKVCKTKSTYVSPTSVLNFVLEVAVILNDNIFLKRNIMEVRYWQNN
jgi:hypothetical protein